MYTVFSEENKMKKITKKSLWLLREEIALNSLYTADFNNSYGFTSASVQNFFDGYEEYLEELMIEKYGTADFDFFAELSNYDCTENLWAWYACFGSTPFIKEVV